MDAEKSAKKARKASELERRASLERIAYLCGKGVQRKWVREKLAAFQLARRTMFDKMGPHFVAASRLDRVRDQLEGADEAFASLGMVPLEVTLHPEQLDALKNLSPEVASDVAKESFYNVLVAKKMLSQLSMIADTIGSMIRAFLKTHCNFAALLKSLTRGQTGVPRIDALTFAQKRDEVLKMAYERPALQPLLCFQQGIVLDRSSSPASQARAFSVIGGVGGVLLHLLDPTSSTTIFDLMSTDVSEIRCLSDLDNIARWWGICYSASQQQYHRELVVQEKLNVNPLGPVPENAEVVGGVSCADNFCKQGMHYFQLNKMQAVTTSHNGNIVLKSDFSQKVWDVVNARGYR